MNQQSDEESDNSDITKKIEIHRQKINKLSQQVSETLNDHDKVEIMVNIIVHQEQRISELNQQILKIQSHSMKNNIIINGLEEVDKEVASEVSKKFLKEKLKIEELEINNAHRMGKGNDRPMVIRFTNQDEKVFGNIKKLKDVKNHKGKSYQVDNQYPESITEDRKQSFLHFKDAKSRGARGKNITLKKGQLLVDNKQHVREIIPPSSEDLIFAPLSIIKKSKELCIYKSKEVIERASRFTGYFVEVQSEIEVKARLL